MKVSDYKIAIKVKEELEAFLDDLLEEIKDNFPIMINNNSSCAPGYLNDFEMNDDHVVMYVKNMCNDTELITVNVEDIEKYNTVELAELLFARYEAEMKVRKQAQREAEMKRDLEEYNRIKNKYNL